MEKKPDKVQVPQQNEMLSLYCTAVKMKNIIPNKIYLTVGI